MRKVSKTDILFYKGGDIPWPLAINFSNIAKRSFFLLKGQKLWITKKMNGLNKPFLNLGRNVDAVMYSGVK
jgi:hypothetical protein